MSLAINRYLDAAILLPQTNDKQLTEALTTCIALDVYSVCVHPCDLSVAQRMCEGTKTASCVVLGFPHGRQLPESKADEVARYIAMGVDEIDMVANYGWANSGRWDDVRADIAGVSEIARANGVLLKVIFETAQLESDVIERLVEVCIEAGADFVKTSTGFNGEGAQEVDVRQMIETAAGRIKVKASGGIRDRARADRFVDMGVDRLGVNWSSCIAICNGGAPSGEGIY